MSATHLILLIAVSFLTSFISVVTGSTSLITVPCMVSVGIEPHTAVATNMMALTFMSLGGSLPFFGKGVLRKDYLPVSAILTAIGSALGALLLLAIPERLLQLTIAAAMICVAGFTLMNEARGGVVQATQGSRIVTFILVFVLAVYGGFFSGGYVTMLMAAFVLAAQMTFLQAIATTKVINLISSGVATLIFLVRGAVDLRLGIVLGVVMLVGGVLGGRWALKLDVRWLRWLFVASVLLLAAVMLLKAV